MLSACDRWILRCGKVAVAFRQKLIGFRALQGLGAVFISGLGLAIITEVFPASERGRAIGIIGSVVSLGVALGPSVGGLLLGLSGWRSIFLVNVPLGILASLLVLRVVPPSPFARPQQFDFIGAVLALLGVWESVRSTGQQSELDYIARFVLFGTGLGLF